MKCQPSLWLIFSLCLTILLSACSMSSAILQANNSQLILAGSSIGQSFTAQNPGMAGIAVMLAPSQVSSEGNLNFQLQENNPSPEVVARATLPLSEITQQRYYRFDFPAQKDSLRKDYFLNIELEGSGQVQFFAAEADSYIDGSLYINGNPQEAQLAFRLEYDRTAYLLGLIPLFAQWFVAILIGTLIFILPGWGLFSLLWTGWDDIIWAAKLGLSGGLSLALYPLLLLWTNLAGLHLGVYYVWLPPFIGIIALLWKNRSNLIDLTRKNHPNRWRLGKNFLPPVEVFLADLAFLCVIGLITVSRFWVIRSLDVPLFGDSYQHSMIAQLIVDHGGLFNSWEPYADLTTFTYHFGFHSLVAVYHWISGLNVEKAVLWTGQLINILAIIGLYPLVFKITKNRWAGVIAMLVAGLLSPMPNYYVNWGRYTQLAGQAILPILIWVVWTIYDRVYSDNKKITFLRMIVSLRYLGLDIGSIVVAWIVLGGLALTHYRILILGVLFFPVIGIYLLARKDISGWIGKTLWIGIGGGVLFLPWFIHVFGGKIMNMFLAGVTTLPSETTTSNQMFINIKDLVIYLPTIIWLVLLFSVALALIRWQKNMLVFILWWLLIILVANPNWIGLPGNGVITNFAVQIAFYIPAGVAIGFVMNWLLEELQNIPKYFRLKNNLRISKYVVNYIALIVVLLLGIQGLPNRIRDLNLTSYALITRPDLRAMTWIQDNLPTDASFLVNSFFAYNNSVVVGSDAGWWIPLLAHRRTTLPPLTYGFEMGNEASATNSADNLMREVLDKGVENPEIISKLIQDGIRYVYIGQRQGTINYNGPKILNPDVMARDSSFEVIYHQDLVWIFKISP